MTLTKSIVALVGLLGIIVGGLSLHNRSTAAHFEPLQVQKANNDDVAIMEAAEQGVYYTFNGPADSTTVNAWYSGIVMSHLKHFVIRHADNEADVHWGDSIDVVVEKDTQGEWHSIPPPISLPLGDATTPLAEATTTSRRHL